VSPFSMAQTGKTTTHNARANNGSGSSRIVTKKPSSHGNRQSKSIQDTGAGFRCESDKSDEMMLDEMPHHRNTTNLVISNSAEDVSKPDPSSREFMGGIISSQSVALTLRKSQRSTSRPEEEMPRPLLKRAHSSRSRLKPSYRPTNISSNPSQSSEMITFTNANGLVFPSATLYTSAPSALSKESQGCYTSSHAVTPKLLASLRLAPEILQKIRSTHLKKMSSATVSSKFYFEHKYAALLNKKNGFHDKRGRKRRKKSSNNGVLAKLHPLNAQEEKQKFLRCFQLGQELKNPKFKFQKKFLASLNANSKKSVTAVWQNNTFECSDMEGTHPYNYVCTKYLSVATKIMHTMKRMYGTLHEFYLSMGDRVSSEDSLNYFAFYLRDQGLSKLGISMEVCEDAASPTFCVGTKLIIRVPMKNYRQGRIQGVAHHEISTHLIRYINDTKQVWHKKKNTYGLRSHIVTEEGLATVHSCVHSPHKLLAHAAIHYYAVVQASRMTFVQLFECLLPWIGDVERTWTECVRVKRGISAKRKGGSFTKDQIYLIGSLKILKLRRKIDIRLLYAGKLALEDLEKVQQNDIGVNLNDLIMPKFIEEDFKQYMRALDEIASVNGVK